MKYLTISEIINHTIDSISNDIHHLTGVTSIDFLDIFPRSEEHKKMLDTEALNLGYIIEQTSRGNFYVFHNPIKTKFGELKIIKIRIYDETRLPWLGAPDFNVLNYDIFKNTYINDKRFTYIEKPTYKGLEFKTKYSLIYFLDEPTTIFYKLR